MATKNAQIRVIPEEPDEDQDEATNCEIERGLQRRGQPTPETERAFADRLAVERAELTKALKLTNSPGRKKISANLIDRAAFMRVSLSDLETAIARDGMVSEYQNGENQFGTKKSPEVDIYNVMIKNYSAIMKQLADLCQPAAGVSPSGKSADDLDAFAEAR